MLQLRSNKKGMAIHNHIGSANTQNMYFLPVKQKREDSAKQSHSQPNVYAVLCIIIIIIIIVIISR